MVATRGSSAVCLVCDNFRSVVSLRMHPKASKTKVKKISHVTKKVMVGVEGFAADAQAVQQDIESFISYYEITERRPPSYDVLLHWLQRKSFTNYKKGRPYFADVIVAGFDKNDEPKCASVCWAGSLVQANCATIGVAQDEMMGMQGIFANNTFNNDELVRNSCESFTQAIKTQTLAGNGGNCVLLTAEGATRAFEFSTQID